MQKKNPAGGLKRTCTMNVLCLLAFALLFSGCGFYGKRFSYFNMLEPGKRTSRNKEAAEKFWASVRPVTTLSDSYYKLGRYYQKQKKYDKAIAEFTKAIRDNRSFCKAYNGIAMSYDALGNCGMARDTYEQALQCDPQEAYIYNNYACSSLLCGDYEKGVALFTKAELLSGESKRIKNNLNFAQSIARQDTDARSTSISPVKMSQAEALQPEYNTSEGLPFGIIQTAENTSHVSNETETSGPHGELAEGDGEDEKFLPVKHLTADAAAQPDDNFNVLLTGQPTVISINSDVRVTYRNDTPVLSGAEKPVARIVAENRKKIFIHGEPKKIIHSTIAGNLPSHETDPIKQGQMKLSGYRSSSYSGARPNSTHEVTTRDNAGYKRLTSLSRLKNRPSYTVATHHITNNRLGTSFKRNRFGFLDIH